MLPHDASREALYQSERRPTLFVKGGAVPLHPLAMEAARLAYLRAEDPGSNAKQRLDEALSRVGFSPATLFVDRASGSFGYGTRRASDRTRLIAFRGTQPDDLNDLLSDLNFPPVDWPESSGRVHAGFARAARSLLPAVRQWLADTGNPTPHTPDTLMITGHSLGAAMATLAAATLKPALLVTLGCPRVGNAAFANALAASVPGTRYVDCADIVTQVPPAVLDYTHAYPPRYITAQGELVDQPTEAQMAADRRRAKATYLLQQSWRPGHVLLRSFADHAPINYLRAFF